ncbi:N-methylhydantoinase A [Paraburkholderia sp. BL6665CI2N2]|uniref:hydantoinase/oxoprolinase family protein n=1 Tax=Paraburkholderia sp. BL6665CI2N2 TaxID=1938806 RepID=UPI001064CFBC|nr:hydantoinase/oxoprolinase family protein [Paraburkholderia sp. BL6665CI2N2]TDY21864.1 N-methylhydantoinase A [Paraburkholderia sp. BL6665CI2N2]
MAYRVGVDIGGSFTDFAVLDEKDNTIRTLKVLSRPDEPGAEIRTGMAVFAERDGIAAADVSYFTHGTTVGVNTVIQRKGAKLALLTTLHFEDVLELGRLKMPRFHNLYARRPVPLVPRHSVFGIHERTDAAGKVLTEVDATAVMRAFEQAQEQGCEAIVISFLHSYRNPENERAAKAAIADIAPSFPVFCSSDVWPIIREYERTVTGVISGYVQPKVARYLTAFEEALNGVGVPVPPRITKSNGGVMSARQAKEECVQMILSGTASGVIGAGYLARMMGLPRILSLDIGGTSADVAVIVDGAAEYGAGELIGEFPIFIPSVSVTSIGQGGGSIAWVDDLGVLQVGPESAGSSPGPACFDKGGLRPAVTDAFAACGLIGHSKLGYSAVNIDVKKAQTALAPLADALNLSLFETAESIITIAVSGMFADTSGLMSRFGIDPREFYLLAFGGAGPMMACFLARELNIKGVIVPPTPGVLSALGGLIADLKNDFIKTLYIDLDADSVALLKESFDALKLRAEHWLYRDQQFEGESTLSYTTEMRYRGQSFEIEVPLDPDWVAHGDLDAITAAFHAQHQRLFGHSDSLAPLQMISLRLLITGKTPRPALARIAHSTAAPVPAAFVDAYVDGEVRNVALYQRAHLLAGQCFDGPATVAQDDCTTCVLPAMSVTVDTFGNLVITMH